MNVLIMSEGKQDITAVLEALKANDPHSSTALLPLVYDELRRLAAARMAQEQPGQTLQATALVHEAWLRLVASDHQDWENRAHFFGAAALAMRRILVENARRKHQLKHGGQWHRVQLEGLDLPGLSPDDKVLAIDDALSEFAKVAPTEAQVVNLRFFAGMQYPEIAAVLKLSERTVHRYWSFAKVWLYEHLNSQLKVKG